MKRRAKWAGKEKKTGEGTDALWGCGLVQGRWRDASGRGMLMLALVVRATSQGSSRLAGDVCWAWSLEKRPMQAWAGCGPHMGEGLVAVCWPVWA